MDGYSRLIALLKVLLPLMALGLLSTLFLLSQNSNPDARIPFADSEMRDRLDGQQVTKPFFSATTRDGDRILVSSNVLTTRDGKAGENEIEELSAQFDLVGGTRVNLMADSGFVSIQEQLARLTGNVVFTTSTGYRIESQQLTALMSYLNIRSPGPVQGEGPLGRLESGAMVLNQPEGQESPHLLFTDGVKVLYQPGD